MNHDAQLTLIMPLRALARSSDPSTSHQAARKVDTATLVAMIKADLALHPSSTMHEIADRIDVNLVSVSPRFAPMRRNNDIEADGKRDGRTTWKLKAKG